MQHGEGNALTGNQKAVYGVLITLLVVAAGGTAGLQVALFSIDRVFLRVLSTTGTPRERRQANKLLRVLGLQHWTLVSLTLMNASCMMSLPIVLESIFDELTALIVSITAVLFLGEVIPLSIFVRWAIPICAFFSPVMWLGIFVTAPISYPVGRLLDRLLGTEEPLLDREDLAALIMAAPPSADGDSAATTPVPTQPKRRKSSSTEPSPGVELRSTGETAAEEAAVAAPAPNPYRLRETEVKMLHGAMQLSTDTVGEHLCVREPQAFMLSTQDLLDRETIRRVLQSGFSRVPVYFGDDRTHIVGALIVNSLLKLCFTNPNPPPLVGDYPLRDVMRLSETASLYDAYVAFRDGPHSMAAVYDTRGAMVGLLTLTDVLACMYHMNPTKKVTIAGPASVGRRRERMREIVEGMKYLNAAKNSTSNLALLSPLGASLVAPQAVPRLQLPTTGTPEPGSLATGSPAVVQIRPQREDELTPIAVGGPSVTFSDVVMSLPQMAIPSTGSGLSSPRRISGTPIFERPQAPTS